MVRQEGLAGYIAVTSPDEASTASHLGIADSITLDQCKAVTGADLVMICSPVSTYEAISKTIALVLKRGQSLQMLDQSKERVVRDTAPHIPDGVHFIPRPSRRRHRAFRA